LPVFLKHKRNNIAHRLKQKSYVAQLILILLGVELLFLSAFTAFNLPTATGHNWQRYIIRKLHILYSQLPPGLQTRVQQQLPNSLAALTEQDVKEAHNLRYSLYVPQAPVAIFIGYVLGWPLAVITAVLYLLLAFLGPLIKIYPLTSSNGMDYYLQPGFGYLAGMVIAAGWVGYISQGKRTSTKQLLSLLAGLLCIHGIGLIYMLGISLFSTVYNAGGAQLYWSAWLFEEARNLSWYALPYDFLFSLLLIGIGFPLRWLVNILMSPDIASQNGSAQSENLVNLHPAIR